MIGFPIPALLGQGILGGLKNQDIVKRIQPLDQLLNLLQGPIQMAGIAQGLPILKSALGGATTEAASDKIKSKIKPSKPAMSEDEMLAQVLPFLGIGNPFMKF